jgi:hypothetical protein
VRWSAPSAAVRASTLRRSPSVPAESRRT